MKQTRQVAYLDLILTWPFAFPFIAEFYVSLMYWLHHAVALDSDLPAFAPMHWVFVNIMGVLAVLWAYIRIRYTTEYLGRADAFARLFVTLLLLYWIIMGATPVLMLFITTEIGGALYVLWPRESKFNSAS